MVSTSECLLLTLSSPGRVSCCVEPTLQNQGVSAGVGTRGRLRPSSPRWCDAASRSSQLGVSLRSKMQMPEGHALLLTLLLGAQSGL